MGPKRAPGCPRVGELLSQRGHARVPYEAESTGVVSDGFSQANLGMASCSPHDHVARLWYRVGDCSGSFPLAETFGVNRTVDSGIAGSRGAIAADGRRDTVRAARCERLRASCGQGKGMQRHRHGVARAESQKEAAAWRRDTAGRHP